MRIRRAQAWPLSMPMAIPYAIAYTSADTAENVVLVLETDDGLVGYGVAAPDETVTGETRATALAALRDLAAPLLEGEDASRAGVLRDLTRKAFGTPQPAAMAAVDMALWDLTAKSARVPLYRLLGGRKDRIETSITIGILPEGETVAQATSWARQGFKAFKLKGGLDAEGDAARCRKVREAIGPDARLIFDANQGFDVATALRFVRAASLANLSMLEQPTPREHPAWLAAVEAGAGLPVMADEALMGVLDAARHAAADDISLFNVKLMKLGGITPSLAVMAIGDAAGIDTMVGCMDEAALGIAAGLALALGAGARYADLDGHIGLAGDPSAAAVTLRDGLLYPAPGAGLGDWRLT